MINSSAKFSWKKVLTVVGVVLFLFLLLDFNYFYANFKFLISGPEDIGTLPVTEVSPKSVNQPNMLYIPSLGVKAPVQYIAKTGETYFQQALENGVVHYPGTANPGEFGNVYIFGHSSDYIWSKGHYKSVFAVLPNVQIGAIIIITNASSTKFSYTVTKSFVVAANDTSVLDQGGNAKKILSLQTSWPVGTALKRFVVVAEMK